MAFQFGDEPVIVKDESFPVRTNLQRPSIDLSLFDNLPVYVPPASWSVEDIFEFMPNGSSGIDGQSVEWLSSLSYDALIALVSLLDLADAGYLPTFWSHARVTLIPKGEDSAPDDRRPLTVMAVVYRLWAKKHVHFQNKWLESFKPKGLSGSVSGVSCPDVLWEVQNFWPSLVLVSCHQPLCSVWTRKSALIDLTSSISWRLLTNLTWMPAS